MKFLYAYHDKDNKRQEGLVCAASRDAAYACLKKQGVKPVRVEVAPGLMNHVLLIGKRGFAIVLLSLASVIAVIYAVSIRSEAYQEALEEPRQQLYGDPVVLREAERCKWANVFTSAFDRRLAAYAIPGRSFDAVLDGSTEVDLKPVEILPTDLSEHAKMKRIVNGMKREMGKYLAAGGTVDGYFRRLDIRQNAERGICERFRRELSHETNAAVWNEKNSKLRAMGLPMVERDE